MPAADWLLLGVSMTVSLGLLELFLRLFFPLYPSPYQPDDALLVKIVPNAKKVYTRLPINGGQRIVSQFNSHGFRGGEPRPLDHLKRMIVYGDSNVEAEFSELPATFPKQLESRLKPSLGEGVEVLNAGVVGDGPDQISLRLTGDLGELKPALVVVVVFADNDFGDLIRNRIYRLDSRGDIELNRYRLAPDLRTRMQRAAYPHGLRRLQLARYAAKLFWTVRERWLPHKIDSDHEFIADYVDRSLALNQAVFRDYMSDGPGVGYAADPFYDYYDADIALQPDSPSARYKIALMEKVLVKLRDAAAHAATGLVVIILPSAIDVCDHFDLSINARRYPQYDRARLSGLLEDMAVRNGIPYLSLWHAFREEDANRYYFHGGDNHWSDAGQAKAAQLLADLIVRRRLLGNP
jgi:GDSL-like Lipase/Acylhydrolase family